MNKEAGNKLEKARKAKGLKQQTVADILAEKLGQSYSVRQYQKMEDGEFPKFKKEVVKQLDDILGTNLYEEIYEQKGEQFDSAFARRMLETLAEGFANQARLMERMERNMARQDSQAEMQDTIIEMNTTLENLWNGLIVVSARQAVDRDRVLPALSVLRGKPEDQLLTEANKMAAEIFEANGAQDKLTAKRR